MNIVILATRISGNDGVSLECIHWKEILERKGHRITLLAGQLDRGGVVMPELHFQWPKVSELHDNVVYGKGSYKQVEAKIFDIAGTIEGKLRHYFNGDRKLDLLIVANVLSLPMNFPLAVALTRVIEELNITTIARHHDFWWERKRYLKSQLFPFFIRWFPPKLKTIKHVVINSNAKKELKNRTGINADIIWDSFDFKNIKFKNLDSYSMHFKDDLGISDDDLVFLQPTRIVPRKRIELSIELLSKLNLSNSILILSGHAGDEGREYLQKVKLLCKSAGIRHKFIGNIVNTRRRIIRLSNGNGGKTKRVYTMWDCYRNCDFVLYPTQVEGFGNQFVESVFFKKPIILTPYDVYNRDIKPLGFKTIEITGNINGSVLDRINELIFDRDRIREIVEHNFELGKKHFSYEWAERKLNKLITNNDLLNTT